MIYFHHVSGKHKCDGQVLTPEKFIETEIDNMPNMTSLDQHVLDAEMTSNGDTKRRSVSSLDTYNAKRRWSRDSLHCLSSTNRLENITERRRLSLPPISLMSDLKRLKKSHVFPMLSTHTEIKNG